MINEALAPLVKRIEALENIVKNVPRLSTAYTSNGETDADKFIDVRLNDIETSLENLASGVSSHAGNTDIHTTGVEKEIWNGKADKNRVATLSYVNTELAKKSDSTSVEAISKNKAEKSDVYTKSEVNDKLAFLDGESYNFNDWTNGALASAIKVIFEKCGGTVES
jgi:hypothetical protein